MKEDSYKLRHEEFVTGLTGGSISEVYQVTFIAVSAYITWCVLQTRFQLFVPHTCWTLTSLIADLALNWLAPLASITLYSSSPLLLNALILAPATAMGLLYKPNLAQSAPPTPRRSYEVSEYLPKRSFLTNYRGVMMILTCLSILAVDFRIFPRRFAKVETWGTSLMDLGVGSFVFSMGLVSSRATLIDTYLEKTPSRWKALITSVKQALTVLLLGLMRLLSVKYFDYQEHVTEYGVHWNFFMTLGMLPPLVSLIGFLPKRIPTCAMSLIIASIYELLLDKTSLGAFVLTAPRTGIISQNKEGIFSFIGYLAIFLAGKSTGYYTLPSWPSSRAFLFPLTQRQYVASVEKRSKYTAVTLLLLSSAVSSVLLHMVSFWLTPSRRLANLPYVLWVNSYNTGYLAVYVLVEKLLLPRNVDYQTTVPLSCEAVNVNGLAIFLLANIGTGLINMNFRTLDASKEASLAILVLYMTTIFAISLTLYRKKIRIKI
jgi:phosphatidylinositol glycan class W